MNEYSLDFDGYYLDATGIPSCPGIYCIYSCIYDDKTKTVDNLSLLYIGQAMDLKG